jgi:hypothetical protein
LGHQEAHSQTDLIEIAADVKNAVCCYARIPGTSPKVHIHALQLFIGKRLNLKPEALVSYTGHLKDFRTEFSSLTPISLRFLQ